MSDRREKKLAKSPDVDGGIITVVRAGGHIGGLSPPRTPAFNTRHACLEPIVKGIVKRKKMPQKSPTLKTPYSS